MRIEYIFIRKNTKPVQVSEKIHTLSPPFKPFLRELFDDVTNSSFSLQLKAKRYTVSYQHSACRSDSADTGNVMHYLTISIEGQRKERCAEVLNSVNQIIQSAAGKAEYNIIITYDGVSKYYCDRSYPELNEFERNIRNLVFRIVTKAFGTKWLDKTATEEMKDGLKASIQTRPKALRDERLIEEALYEMDIKELENYLFLPQRDISCEQVIDIALSTENLKQMTKEQIEAELDAVRPKSLWERQFADKVFIDGLQETLQQIRVLRNRVAHAKPFSYLDFTKCRGILQKINPQIEKAICDISVKKYDLSETIRTIAGFGDAWTAAVSKSLEFNREISSVMTEIGSSIKEAYRVLDIMPTLKISEAMQQMTDFSPLVSAVQSLPMAKIQESIRLTQSAMPPPAVIQAANQAAQMVNKISLHSAAFEQISRMNDIISKVERPAVLEQMLRMNDLISTIERPALFANGLTPMTEVEEEQPDAESEQGNEEKDATHEKKDNSDDTDNKTE